ncbi:hypothetical protein HX878_27290 [Pseudomonas veronii]|uniref:hypothetical protein n=1 Tax=Pseudomonas veronii TaxID=76761 RepID=UPI0015A2B760|nr:hypothetical protein [Pseudomonas veronii]NWD58423.1 hypothetical protein [Pseudomonas veronii]
MIGTVDNPQLAGKIIQGLWYDNKQLKDVGMDVLRAAGFACKYCGFVSRASTKVPHGYMVPVDVSHSGLAALRFDGAICICPFCASALSINWSVTEHKGNHAEVLPVAGNLIWLPDVTQAKISLVASYVSVGISSMDVGHDHAKALLEIDLAFRIRKPFLASNIPLYKNDSDSDFARALSLLPNEYYEFRDEVLKGVRFWPNSAFWKKQSHYWLVSTYKPIEAKNRT